MPSASPDAPARPDAPEDYPWVGPSVSSALLLGSGVVDLESPREVEAPSEELAQALVDTAAIEQALEQEGALPLSERTLVIAVGSNQTPRTIARKYRRSGRDLPVTTPFVRCTVHDLAVGHVAHIAAPGYVPAAPYRAKGQRMELVVTWFDEEQLAVVDDTEPNYHRLCLRAEDFPLTLATGDRPAHFDVYASRWGVLTDGEQPIPLRHRQQELFDELVALTDSPLTRGDAAQVCEALAADPEALHRLVTEHGLVARDGLTR